MSDSSDEDDPFSHLEVCIPLINHHNKRPRVVNPCPVTEKYKTSRINLDLENDEPNELFLMNVEGDTWDSDDDDVESCPEGEGVMWELESSADSDEEKEEQFTFTRLNMGTRIGHLPRKKLINVNPLDEWGQGGGAATK
jgi:hypothetical protein